MLPIALNIRSAILAATYISLLVALVTTTLLLGSCLPISPGNSSALQEIHALKFQLLSTQGNNTYRIGGFALCASINGTTSCAASSFRTTSRISFLLGHSDPTSEHAVQTAIDLQRKVFLSMPVAVAGSLILLFIAITLNIYIKSQRLQITSQGLAAFAAVLMLVDAFATNRVLKGIVIATRQEIGEESKAYIFTEGKAWQALQWGAFAFSAILIGLVSVQMGSVEVLDEVDEGSMEGSVEGSVECSVEGRQDRWQERGMKENMV